MTISERILDCFVQAGHDTDVYITYVYNCAYADDASLVTFRRQQQRLGARFSILNRQFEAGRHAYGRIVPGEVKRTYRLVKA